MEPQVLGKPVGIDKVKDQLKGWLDETNVNSACALGIKNFTKKHKMVNPRFYLAEGKVEHDPAEWIDPNTASASLFSKIQYALRGSSGCICYDLENSDFMVAVMWYISVSETVSENHFNIRCLPRGLCDEELYKRLRENSHKADGEINIEENGFRLCGCMTRESKSIYIVDCYDASSVGSLRTTESVESGRMLHSRLLDWMRETDVKTVCGIGINNYTGTSLVTPKWWLETGRVVYEPPGVVDSQMGAPLMFSKRKFSLYGTSGCLTYQIQDTNYQLAVLWYLPYSESMHDNRYFATVTLKTECDAKLYKELWEESRSARDGDLIRDDFTFRVSAVMELSARALYIVDLRPKRV